MKTLRIKTALASSKRHSSYRSAKVGLEASGGSTAATAATLTIGSGITVHSTGGNGRIDNVYSFDSVVNQGTIAADVAGKTMTISSGASGTSTGTYSIAGGTLTVSGTLNGGAISGNGTGTLSAGGTLSGVTVAGSVSIGSGTIYTINGLTLASSATLTLNSTDVYCQGTQTLGGSGNVVFAGSGTDYLEAYGGSTAATAATLTIGGGIIVHSTGGNGRIDTIYAYDSVVNQGTIVADVAGKTMTVSTNASGISTGTYNIAGGTLTISGTLNGGTINGNGNGALSAGGTLSGVSVAGSVSVSSGTLYVANGLTLVSNATLTLNSTDIYFQGTQTLGGSGSVVFAGSGTDYLEAYGGSTAATAATLTIGSGVTVHSTGGNGRIDNVYSFDSVVNNGVILADVVGKTMTISSGASGTGIGIYSIAGGTLAVSGTLNGGTISGVGTGSLSAGGTLSGVTIAGSVTVTSGTLYSTNGLTLSTGAALTLNSTDLYFQGTQTLGGSGTVVFAGSGTDYLEAYGGSTAITAATLTIGPGVTVHSTGGNGRIDNVYSFDSVVNQGTIAADFAGKTMTISSGASGTSTGMYTIAGGTLAVSGTLNGGAISSTGLGTLAAGGTLSGVTIAGSVNVSSGTIYVT